MGQRPNPNRETDAKGKVFSWRATTNFRDHGGHVREVSASGKTKTTAEHRLLTKLRGRAKTTQTGELTSMNKINDLIDLWNASRTEGDHRRR